MTLPVGALYPQTYSVPASFGASFLGGSAASASAAATTAAGATGSGAVGFMSGLGATLGWAAPAAYLAYRLFGQKKPIIHKDAPSYNANNDLRTQQDRMYSPMFMSGIGGSSAINPNLAYSQPSQTNTFQDYLRNNNMMGVTGFGRIKGFGGYGGMAGPETVSQTNNTNWTGFSTPLQNFGSGVAAGGTSAQRGMNWDQRSQLVNNSMVGYQLRM